MSAAKLTPEEELRDLKEAIARAIESAAEEPTLDRRARSFVAHLSGGMSSIYGDAEGSKLFRLLRDAV